MTAHWYVCIYVILLIFARLHAYITNSGAVSVVVAVIDALIIMGKLMMFKTLHGAWKGLI